MMTFSDATHASRRKTSVECIISLIMLQVSFPTFNQSETNRNLLLEFHYESLRFTCVICTRIFWNYLALAMHYRNVHPSFTSVFCCHCGKLFHSITAGAIHYKKIMIMLTDEEKKLKKEGKLETEQSSHICHVCGKACKNNYTLLKHITTHEEPDPSKMLQCHICSKL